MEQSGREGTAAVGRARRAVRLFRLPLAVVLLMGTVSIAAVLVAFVRVRDDASTQQRLISGHAAALLQASLASIAGRLEQVAIGLEEAKTINRRTFARNGAPVVREPALAGLAYNAEVPARDRAAYERRTRYQILDGRAGSALHRAGRRSVYFPLTYGLATAAIFRLARRVQYGYDSADDPAQRQALLASRDSGATRSTVPLRIEVAAPITGVFMFTPVYRPGAPVATVSERRRAAVGFVGGVYANFAGNAGLRAGVPGSVGLAVAVDGMPLLASPTRPASPVTRRFTALGRSWSLTVGRQAADAGLVIATAIVGLLLTVLLGLLSLVASRRELFALRRVEQEREGREAAVASRDALEHRLATVFEQAPIGMALAQLDRRLITVNRAFVELTGHEPHELEGRRLAEVLHSSDTGMSDEALAALLDGSLVSWSSEHRLVHAAGHSIVVAVDVGVVRDAQGSPEHLLSSIQDVTERHHYEERLRYLADHDPLTGLLNRRSFERELDRQVAEAGRYGSEGALIVVDLDHFKLVNDSLGHHAGDELICGIALALTRRLRDTDIIARLGGDEFAVLVPRGGPEEATAIADAVLEVVRAHQLTEQPGGVRTITASVGVAMIAAGELIADTLMTNADIAMYEAKERGRDCAAHYRDSEHGVARLKARITWVDRLREALSTNAFELFAQPIRKIDEIEATRFELLIRMRTPDGDVIPPAAFLDVAERFDLITSIDRWVVAKAIELVAGQHAAGRPLSVSVNLSARSIGEPGVLEVIEHELAMHAVDPAAISFEITETSAVADLPRAQAFARRLHDLGCEVALDDFGAGFGNFFYLKHLPFDYVKIDGEFVRNATVNLTDRLVVEAVAWLARGLGKRTVAEFVASEATLKLMRELGIDYVQGFHVGQPMPFDYWTAAIPAP